MNNQLSTEEIQQIFPDFIEPGLHQVMAAQGRVHHFREGDVIMDYGSNIRMLPLIITGSIKVSRLSQDGSELFLYYLTRGESCTMTFSCCIGNKRSQIKAMAEEDTVILGLPQERLDEWMMRYKSWKNFVMKAYDQRMTQLIATIDQVTFHQLDDRLLEYVTKRANIHQNRTINTTHQMIANDLNVSREAISRLLKALEKKSIVSLSRNRITLLQ